MAATRTGSPQQVMVLTLLNLLCCAWAADPQSSEYLLRMIARSRPPGTDADFDCSWRHLAFEYHQQIAAGTTSPVQLRALHDALELGTLCGTGLDLPGHSAAPPPASYSAAPPTFFVAPTGANSSARPAGTFPTVEAALGASNVKVALAAHIFCACSGMCQR